MSKYGTELIVHQVATKHDDQNRFLIVYCQLPIFCNGPRKSSASNLNDCSLSPRENSANKRLAEGRSILKRFTWMSSCSDYFETS